MPRAAAGSAGAKKGRAPKAHKLPEKFAPGETLYQAMNKKKWQLGDVIGQGGFGLIYKAYDVTDGPADLADPYVIKIEPHDNGPLFCEIHFYQRVARPENIADWSRHKKLRYLAVPPFFGTGQHKKGDKQYRFLVLPHLSTDLQKIFEQNGRCFSEKSAFAVGIRMLDALEFIHDKGYCHADVKAANILLGCRGGKTDCNQVYLVDYGLAYRFLVDGAQKPYKEDPKRAHDGTVEFTSRDAHRGVFPSRRGDLEILGYCLLEWLCGHLPWAHCLEDKDLVRDLKIQYMNDLPDLFKTCFAAKPCPEGLRKYLNVVSKLAYDEKPDYGQLRQFLKSGMSSEWTLGLSDPASPTKGTKRKPDTPGPSSSPKKKSRPNSSPTRTPSKASISNGSATLKAASTSRSKPALVNGSARKAKAAATKTARGKATDVVVDRRKSSGIIPGARGKAAWGLKAKKTPLEVIPGAAEPSTSKGVIIPGAPDFRPGTKVKASPAKRTLKRKSPVDSPSVTGSSSASSSKAKARVPQKRRRNKAALSADSAVQTSPGFGLRRQDSD